MPFRIPVDAQEPLRTTTEVKTTQERMSFVTRTGTPYQWPLPEGINRVHITSISVDILTSNAGDPRYLTIRVQKKGTATSGHPATCHILGVQGVPVSTSGFWSFNIGASDVNRNDATVGYVESKSLPSQIYLDQGEFLNFVFHNGVAGDTVWIKILYEVIR